MTALDRLGELTHILFFGFKRLRGEKPRWKAGKVCVRTSRHVRHLVPGSAQRGRSKQSTVNRKKQQFESRGQAATCLVNVSLTAGDA